MKGKVAKVNDKAVAIRIVSLLNQIIESDSEALRLLVQHRVPCSAELANHPTVQVGNREEDRRHLHYGLQSHPHEVGLLGILNGIVGADKDGLGFVAITQEDDGTITGACLVPNREFCDKPRKRGAR